MRSRKLGIKLMDMEACSDSSDSSVDFRPRKRFFCDHCRVFLSKSAYYRHKEKFFDRDSNRWKLDEDTFSSDSSSVPSLSQNESFIDEGNEMDQNLDDEGVNKCDITSEYGCSSSETTESEDSDFAHEEIWSSSDSDQDSVCANVDRRTNTPTTDIIWKLAFFLVMWQAIYHVSNAAITSILSFVKYFIRLIGTQCETPRLQEMSNEVPLSYARVRSVLGIEDTFIEYVVCPKCQSIYEYDDCVQAVSGHKESKVCRHISFPNHPHVRARQPCSTQLLKKIKKSNGFSLVPIQVYAYSPIVNTLQRLVYTPSFLHECEHWRKRLGHIPQDILGDVYDGQIWKDFLSEKYDSFLKSPQCYLLSLNVDWFQPYSHLTYSVGCIYLTILNLPREIRYLEENVLLVGIIPGPTEPKQNINSYLSPLIEELKEAWNGIQLQTVQGTSITVRLALACVTCDIPATRKVCGFLGHTASLGCNKCLKRFSIHFDSPADYSGCDRDSWEKRTAESHRQHCKEILEKSTKSAVQAAESKYGVRYSVLLSLPYYNPIDFVAIDVMHNLFLGTGKRMLKLWIDMNLLCAEKLSIIEERVRSFQVPTDIGRLPNSISSNYGGFTAIQWRNWIIIYSPVVLRGLLPQDHLQCWLLFVRATFILSKRIITKEEVKTADLYLLHFCKKFEQLYPKTSFTPNLHLHMHLCDVFLNLGPAHSFWCFSFERFNGLLGSFTTNKKAIEVQVMRKFCTSQSVRALIPQINTELLCTLKSSGNTDPYSNVTHELSALQLLNTSHCSLDALMSYSITGCIQCLPPTYKEVMNNEQCSHLELIYSHLYPGKTIKHLPRFFCRFKQIAINKEIFSSGGSNNNSVVAAYWPSQETSLDPIDLTSLSIGVVQYFMKHTVSLFSEVSGSELDNLEHIFAVTLWKQKHPRPSLFGASATVCFNLFENFNAFSFLPVQRIANRCAHCIMKVDIDDIEETLFIACPISRKFVL